MRLENHCAYSYSVRAGSITSRIKRKLSQRVPQAADNG